VAPEVNRQHRVNIRSQVTDHRERGDNLENISMLHFFVDTHEEKIREGNEDISFRQPRSFYRSDHIRQQELVEYFDKWIIEACSTSLAIISPGETIPQYEISITHLLVC
jgi:hypothetical protein